MSPTGTLERPAAAARSRIDPRIAERRTRVTRQRGRRRLSLLLGAAVAAAVVVAAWLALHSSLFSARHVVVRGAVHSAPGAVIAAAGLASSPPLIDVNAGAAAAAVGKLPWVRSATVSRQWPDTVVVTVTERVPLAVVPGSGSAYSEVDRSGRVLVTSTAGPLPAGLVHLSLPSLPGAVGTTLPATDLGAVAVARSLPPAFVAQVASVGVQPGGELQLTLSDGLVVDLGDTTQLGAKYEDVAAMLAHATLHTGDVLDVSVPDSPVVTGP